jgi:hypothetical protein
MEEEKRGKIKIESEKRAKNVVKCEKSRPNHGINRVKVELMLIYRGPSLYPHSIFFAWKKKHRGAKCWQEKTGSEKNPRPHERKMFPFNFFVSTYIRMEGIIALTKLAT